MSYSFQNLTIETGGLNIENAFLKQNGQATNLAVVFPGAGYTTMGPMLYYTADVLLDRGHDVLLVEYGRLLTGGDPETRAKLLGDIAEIAVQQALQQRTYDRVILVGKSVGTRALAHLSQKQSEWNPDQKPVRSIWLTPLLGSAELVDQIGRLGESQFLATGTEDHPHYQTSALAKLPTSVEKFVVPGANHGLDISGNVLASVRVMEELIRKITDFGY